MTNSTESYTCGKCGRKYEYTGEREVCRGNEFGRHDAVDVVYPCGVCGAPITMLEMCEECAEKSDVDSITPTWG